MAKVSEPRAPGQALPNPRLGPYRNGVLLPSQVPSRQSNRFRYGSTPSWARRGGSLEVADQRSSRGWLMNVYRLGWIRTSCKGS